MKTLFDDQLMDELKAEVERRRCPECGAHVFIHNLQDFKTFIGEMRRGNFGVVGVYCSDMGHWAGYLHECRSVLCESAIHPTATISST